MVHTWLAKARAAVTTRERGLAAEEQAWAYLQAQGLRQLARNFRAPGRSSGEIDGVWQTADGTVVFVEVRSRSRADFGGAGASIGRAKRQRLLQTAQYWLQMQGVCAPCRFDVVLLDGPQIQWLQAAFGEDGS